jgi:hypothetical protein
VWGGSRTFVGNSRFGGDPPLAPRLRLLTETASASHGPVASVAARGLHRSTARRRRVKLLLLSEPHARAIAIGELNAGRSKLISDVGRVTGRFNHQLEDLVLAVLDEMAWAGNERARGVLQSLITEKTFMVEPKNVGMYQVRNMLHVVMLAEPGKVIPAGAFERRYAAFELNDAKHGDFEYFGALRAQIEGDGPGAMLWDLARMDLDGWHPRQLPQEVKEGPALLEQQSRSLPPLHARRGRMD